MFSIQEAVQFQYPGHEPGLTPTEIQELLSLFQSENPLSPNSGFSQGSNQSSAGLIVDERKSKRKISNRESARRSRQRKKRHLEDLTNTVNRFRAENQELKNLLGLVLNRFHAVHRENERLRSESVALLARLSDLNWILANMQNYNNYGLINC